MEAIKAVFDSDVLIDYLQGLPAAKSELARYRTPCYSIISFMELLAGARCGDPGHGRGVGLYPRDSQYA